MGCNHSIDSIPNQNKKPSSHVRSQTFSSYSSQSNDGASSPFSRVLDIYEETQVESRKLRDELSSCVQMTESSISNLSKSFQHFTKVFSKKNLHNYSMYQEDLECAVCGLPYNTLEEKPIELPCEHTFCLKCLKKDYAVNGTITCIIDMTEFDIDPMSLEENGQLKTFVDSSDEPLYCEDHILPLTKLCSKDKKLLCSLCESEHHGHIIYNLGSSDKDEKLKIDELLTKWKKSAESYVSTLKDRVQEFEKCTVKAKQEEKTIRETIETHIAEVKQARKSIIDKINEAAMNYIEALSESSKKIFSIAPSGELKDASDRLNGEISKAEGFLRDFDSKTNGEKLERLKNWDMDVPNELNPPDLSSLISINSKLQEIKDFYSLILSEAIYSKDIKL
ncbi:unnamed protein product [Blepharisma stoltei]|uniref:RING-type domain-containing protein n=1 Tax=Blepharisma stoltei TaxID=1481888 RepID=A0AAU9IAU5_9CILI|nr:unnamed protein product [Blepharisma stoltei]